VLAVVAFAVGIGSATAIFTVLLAFTDGVPEAHNPGNDEFGEERLQQLLRQTAHLPANAISARLSEEMKGWILDAEQYDDLTFIVMKVR
jgi:serine phosphatase RsbU (regulator of sigma subunit)